MTLAVLRCGRCGEPVDEVVGYVDIYGAAVCRACHEAEWALEDEGTE